MENKKKYGSTPTSLDAVAVANIFRKLRIISENSIRIQDYFTKVIQILHFIPACKNCLIAQYDEKNTTLYSTFEFINFSSNTLKDSKLFQSSNSYSLNEYLVSKKMLIHLNRDEIKEKIEKNILSKDTVNYSQWIGIPLFDSRNNVIGIFSAYNKNDLIFDIQSVEILQFIASQIALHIDRYLLNEEILESEEKYLLAIENISDAIFVMQNDKFIFFNNTFHKLLGYKRSELQRTKCSTVFKNPGILKIFNKNNNEHQKLHCIHRNEHIVTVIAACKQIMYRNEPAIFCSLQDISSKVIMKKILGDERVLLDVLINSIPDFIYIKDNQGRYITANNSYKKLLGLDSGETIKGKSDFELISDNFAHNFKILDNSFFKSKSKSVTKEFFWKNTEGNNWYLLTKVAIQDSNNEKYAYLGIGHNITTRIKAEKKIKKSLNKLQSNQDSLVSTTQIKTAQAMGVSANHEMNQPLTVLSGYLQMLKESMEESGLSQTQEKFFNELYDAIEDIETILIKFVNVKEVSLENYIGDTEMLVIKDSKNLMISNISKNELVTSHKIPRNPYK